MKSSKKLLIILAALSTLTFSSVNIIPAQAAAHSYSYYARHWRKRRVKLTRTIKAYKLIPGKHTYQDRLGRRKIFRKGRHVTIQTGGASYDWFIYSHGTYVYQHATTKWFK